MSKDFEKNKDHDDLDLPPLDDLDFDLDLDLEGSGDSLTVPDSDHEADDTSFDFEGDEIERVASDADPDFFEDLSDDVPEGESFSSSSPSAFEEEDEEGDVALSEDELGNILEDVDESNMIEADGEGSADLDDMHEADLLDSGLDFDSEEPIDLDASPDSEIDEIEDHLPELPELDTSFEDFETDQDSFVNESDDELINALSDEPVSESEENGPEDTDFPEESIDDLPMPALDLDSEEDEDITLTPEELGNIISDTEETGEDFSTDLEAESEFPDAPESKDPASFLDLSDDDDEGPIALSDEELENILEDVDSEEPVSEDETPFHEFEKEMPFHETPAFAQLQDEQERKTEAAAAEAGLNPAELKKMISYLDNLFDQLPESTIKEFSKSEYFDLYKKIMGDLGLG